MNGGPWAWRPGKGGTEARVRRDSGPGIPGLGPGERVTQPGDGVPGARRGGAQGRGREGPRAGEGRKRKDAREERTSSPASERR